jgi:hypothetical protein
MSVHPYEGIEAFAIGALESEDARRLMQHADQCQTCAIVLAEAMQVAAGLEPEQRRPINVAARVYPRASRRRTLASWAAGIAAAAALVALTLYNDDLRSSSLNVPVAALVHSHFTHHALRGTIGSAKVIQALDGSWLYLVADNLKPKSEYSLWEIAGARQREVGTFSTNSRGQASAYFQQPAAKVRALIVRAGNQAGSGGPELRWP